MASTQETIARGLARQLIEEVINRGRMDLLDQIFTPELSPSVRSALQGFRSAFPDWREEIVELVEEHDTIVLRLRCSGTFQAEYQGFAPNGRRQVVDEVFFLRLRGIRFTDYWGIEDQLSRLRQLGLIGHVPAKDSSAVEGGDTAGAS